MSRENRNSVKQAVVAQPAKSVRGTLARLDEYWFGHGSPTSLGLFRIFMASLIFINHAMILIDFNSWFSERGFVPLRAAVLYRGTLPAAGNFLGLHYDFHFNVPRIDLLAGVTDDRISLAIYLAIMLATLLCAFGLWTRLTSILMAVGIVSLHHRNGVILHGGDSVMRISALYIALAPSGAACSLDRIIGLWKGKIAPGPVRVSLWAQRLIAYNTALIYFTTFWNKFGFGSHWRDLTATWYPARLGEFYRFPVPSFLNDLPFVYFSTFFTLATELSLGTLVFYRPLRKWVLLAGVGLHAYIDYSMNIPLFSYLMISLYICFYEGEEVDGWAKRIGERFMKFKAHIFLPAGMRLKPAHAAALEAMDPMDWVDYEPGDAPAWDAIAKGRHVGPFRAALSRSIGAWPIGAIPYLWKRLLTGSLESAPISLEEEPQPKPKAKMKR